MKNKTQDTQAINTAKDPFVRMNATTLFENDKGRNEIAKRERVYRRTADETPTSSAPDAASAGRRVELQAERERLSARLREIADDLAGLDNTERSAGHIVPIASSETHAEFVARHNQQYEQAGRTGIGSDGEYFERESDGSTRRW